MQSTDECFAVRGVTIIDLINPATHRTHLYGKTLADCQAEPDYAGKQTVERMTVEEFCRSKAALQDVPITWTETTEERYGEMLEVLPPIAMGNGGFLVGEPWDHHALTGDPRFQAYRQVGERYEASNRAMTVQEFRQL